MDDGERRSKLFNAEQSALSNMRQNSDSVFKDGKSSDAEFNKGDDSSNKPQSYGGQAQKVDDKADKRQAASDILKQNEDDAAADDPNKAGSGRDKNVALDEKEYIAHQFHNYRNAVKGVKEIQSGKVSKGFGTLKKGGPVFIILGILALFGGASFLGQMSMPFSLMAQLQDKFDSISVSNTMRYKSFFRFQTTNNGNNYNLVRVGFFSPAKFKITARQKMKLEKGGKIQVIDDVGNGRQGLLYEGKIVVADPADATNGRIALDDIYESDVGFRNAYTEGTRTMRGSVAAWFDERANEILDLLHVNRNSWKKYDGQDMDAETAKNKIANDADGDFDGTYKATNETEADITDESTGKTTTDYNVGDDAGGSTTERIQMNSKSSKTEIGNQLAKVGTALGVANAGINFICGVMDIATAFKALIVGYQAMQNLAVVQSFLESINKAQAGDDHNGLIHKLMDMMTKRTKTTYETTDYDSVNWNGEQYEAGSTSIVTVFKSAMEASPMAWLFGGEDIDMSDPSVQSFQPNVAINRGLNKVFDTQFDFASGINLDGMTSASAFRNCAITRAVTSAAMAGLTILLWLFPPAGAAASAAGTGAKAALKAALTIAMSVIIAFIIPYVGNMLARNAFKEVTGVDVGTIFPSTTNRWMGLMHTGGAVADEQGFLLYRREQEKVIADKARYERDTHSPFDITSKYTFLGSLASQMIPLASQMSSLNSAISNFGSILSNSFASLFPNSSAVNDAIDVQKIKERTEKYCPDVYEIGALADEECNVYKVTDVRTMDYDPAANADAIFDENLDPAPESGDGMPTIKKGSNLAKFVEFCSERQSMFGIADQNIATKLNPVDSSNYWNTGNSNVNTGASAATDAAIGMIPVVGDIVDVIGNSEKAANLGWISGESCVVNNNAGDDLTSSAISWSGEADRFQRFIEDDHLYSIMRGTKSATQSYLEEYYKENPIDESFEGTLARYSGLTKDNVIAMLDLIEVQTWIADYEPADLMPYAKAEEKAEEIMIEGSDVVETPVTIIAHEYYFEPRRNYGIA